ncbi:Vancomycin B-type resistance protein VanW [Caloramator mitchellensis]|uniref:Vancomycin B-type resistance protein VanW n=1 Tax=Caloramator mitchellensis TaxID=908809 RepID=A0A0R3JWR6_CALMK|nr:VanW family protein [Caloramator mitchellensis]KRQ88006.1 Vancomycin B-type resistance protein VanW [Caloramator mitchellensis]
MNKGLKIAIPLLIIALILAFGIILLNETSASSNRIYKGIYINNINVGGMTYDEAYRLLNEKFNIPLQEKVITLKYRDKEFRTTNKLLETRYDIEEKVNEALNYGKEGNIFEKTIERLKISTSSINLQLEIIVNEKNIDGVVNKISKSLITMPVDATIKLIDGKFIITPDVNGRQVDDAKLKEILLNSVKTTNSEELQIPVKVVEAKIKQDDLEKIDTRISAFATKFNPADVNRTGNLKIASSSIDGTLVMPGEVFSMNKVLGPRVASKGYKEAPVIINGTLVPGLAGGICQVTSTVYNAALLANFEIVERRPHGLKVSYVPAGRDATISGNIIDFKFKNTNKTPLYIRAWVGKNYVNVEFYSANENPNMNVVIESEIIERIPTTTEYVKDSNLYQGEKVTEVKPIDGIKSITYRKVFINGELVKKETLSKDYYKPAKGRVRIGTKPVSTQTDNTSENQKSQDIINQ